MDNKIVNKTYIINLEVIEAKKDGDVVVVVAAEVLADVRGGITCSVAFTLLVSVIVVFVVFCSYGLKTGDSIIGFTSIGFGLFSTG